MPFSDLRERVAEIRERVARAVARGGHGQQVCVVAVTKTFGPDAVRAACDAGIADIGENKVQEALGKQASPDLADLPDLAHVPGPPIRWHLIGHLQRNKVKALEHFHLFHALDSARLADAVDAWAAPRNAKARVLVQMNVAGEETKGGYALPELEAEAARLRAMAGLEVLGVMTMAPFDAPERVLRETFAGARAARDAGRRRTPGDGVVDGDVR